MRVNFCWNYNQILIFQFLAFMWISVPNFEHMNFFFNRAIRRAQLWVEQIYLLEMKSKIMRNIIWNLTYHEWKRFLRRTSIRKHGSYLQTTLKIIKAQFEGKNAENFALQQKCTNALNPTKILFEKNLIYHKWAFAGVFHLVAQIFIVIKY